MITSLRPLSLARQKETELLAADLSEWAGLGSRMIRLEASLAFIVDWDLERQWGWGSVLRASGR